MCWYSDNIFLPIRTIVEVDNYCLKKHLNDPDGCWHKVGYMNSSDIYCVRVLPGAEIYAHLKKQKAHIPIHFWPFCLKIT